jgi:hypothetical protein
VKWIAEYLAEIEEDLLVFFTGLQLIIGTFASVSVEGDDTSTGVSTGVSGTLRHNLGIAMH